MHTRQHFIGYLVTTVLCVCFLISSTVYAAGKHPTQEERDVAQIIQDAQSGSFTETRQRASQDLLSRGEDGLKAIEPYAHDVNRDVRLQVAAIVMALHSHRSLKILDSMADDSDPDVAYYALQAMYCYRPDELRAFGEGLATPHLLSLLKRQDISFKATLILSAQRDNEDVKRAFKSISDQFDAPLKEPAIGAGPHPGITYEVGSPYVAPKDAMRLVMSNVGDADSCEGIAMDLAKKTPHVREFCLWHIDWICSRRILLALCDLGNDTTPVPHVFGPVVSRPGGSLHLAAALDAPAPVFRVRDQVLIALAGKFNVPLGIPGLDQILSARNKLKSPCHSPVVFDRPLTDEEARQVRKFLGKSILRTTREGS